MLTSEVIEGFRKAGIPRTYNAGEAVVLANEPSTGMYVIIKGEVKVVRRDAHGNNHEIATMGPGQTMGELSLLLGQAHSATIIAKTDLEVLLLTQSRLDKLRQESPDLTLRLFEILAFTLAGHLVDVNRQIRLARNTIDELEQKIRVMEEMTSVYSYYSSKF